MLEPLKFRQRIALLVALAAAALLAVTAVALVLGRRSERQFSGVETRYLPLLELDRDLKQLFAGIPRALEDAVSAAEEGRLADADRLRDQLVQRLLEGRGTIAANGGDAEVLLREFRAYYDLARPVSASLMAGAAGEELVQKIEAMRAAQQSFAAHLDAATTPDRARIAAAFRAARAAQRSALIIDVAVACGAFLVMLLLSWWIIRAAARSLQAVSQGMERLARGDFNHVIEAATRDEFGDLAREANLTALRLREYREQSDSEDWIKTGVGGLVAEVAGEQQPAALGRRAVTYLARYLGAPIAACYGADRQGTLRLLDTYAFAAGRGAPHEFRLGEGIVGQAARDDEVRLLSDVPPDYASVRSALGEAPPRHLLVAPYSHEGRVMGVVELGFLEAPPERALELVRRIRGALGIAFQVAESREHVQALLEETQRQAEELEARNRALIESEGLLQAQQEELRQTNEELEQQAEALAAHRSDVLRKNEELVATQQLLEDKAVELARASRYKSEFLANMSHELRTPLNSIMILSKILADNEDGSLGEKQVEFAGVIHKSGDELLALINDVLDLAKVEAGKQELSCELVAPAELGAYVRRMFQQVADQKALALEVEFAGDLPARIRTDRARLEQILKNLISNAIKFTAQGRVAVTASRAGAGPDGRDAIAIAVADTGPGIPADKLQRIFEAFAQADGGTSRKYGGTGLGLTIARQLAIRLGGDLQVRSELGKGSTFVVRLPVEGPLEEAVSAAPARAASSAAATPALEPAAAVADDRQAIGPGDQCLLVIEDDARYAELVLRQVREAGFRGLVAGTGGAGLELARRHKPSGIILDVGLPDVDGWSVMERLKSDRATREIPVHFLTAADDSGRARRMGAVGMLTKPVDHEQIGSAIRTLEEHAGAPVRVVVVVESDPGLRESLRTLLSEPGWEVDAVATDREALQRLRAGPAGCVVLDLALPDKQAGFALLAAIRGDARTASLPVIVHTALALTPAEVRRLEGDDQAIVVVQGERSGARVLEETRLFLHRVRTGLPEQRQRTTEAVHGHEPVFAGRKVLIVDDDMRNVYSLSSALRAKDLRIVAAEDGEVALEQLERNADTDVVLMDIMMPRMDGLEAIGRIRKQPRFEKLPIIALTAKTMPGERKKCIDAGASDYIPKPVDVDRLFALLRVWLSG